MSYCLNTHCPQPKNAKGATRCRACGSKLIMCDRYSIYRPLGKGGFGSTYLALDISLPGTPPCVIKQLNPPTDDASMFNMAKELFEREAQTLGRVGNHPQVPRLLDYFEWNQQFYLVQEYVKGLNLQQEIKKNGPFSEAGVKQFLSEILPIIRDIHAQRVIHRDIKPANIIRRQPDSRLVLIDFGVVKDQVNTVASTPAPGEAFTAFAVGTPGFAPPEQLAMRPVYASDIYAIGVTSVYLLTTKSPKDMESDPLTGEINWNKYLKVSNGFHSVLKKMLAVSVRDRYKNAEEVLQALDMAPYMESLAQGMVTGIFNSKPAETQDFSEDQPRSASAKLAEKIRARRASRNTGVTTAYKAKTTASKSYSSNGVSQAKPQTTNITQIGAKSIKMDSQSLLKAYAAGRRNFNGQNLSFIELAKTDLDGINCSGSKLIKADLQNSNLATADFCRANLSHACLRKANLFQAHLIATNLEEADLRGADLTFANLKDAKLKGANLCGANLSNANITKAQLDQAKINWSTILPSGRRSFW